MQPPAPPQAVPCAPPLPPVYPRGPPPPSTSGRLPPPPGSESAAAPPGGFKRPLELAGQGRAVRAAGPKARVWGLRWENEVLLERVGQRGDGVRGFWPGRLPPSMLSPSRRSLPLKSCTIPSFTKERLSFRCPYRARTSVASGKAAGAAWATPRQGITSPIQGPCAVLAAEVVLVPAPSLGLSAALGEDQLVTSWTSRT